MVYKLSPLHDKHGELLRVVRLVPVDHGADQPGLGQRTVGHGSPELLDTVAVVGGKEAEEGHEGGAPGGMFEIVASTIWCPVHRRKSGTFLIN